ncbi:MAG TPA: hypothetical protein VGO87_14910 [Acidimicrobiia bacterium]
MPGPRMRARALVGGGAAVLVLLIPSAAFAHEQRQVGAVQFTVGWQHEPTYAGSENGIQLFLKDAKDKPIDDLGDPPSLQVQVMTGNQTSDPLALAPSFDEDTGLGTHGEFDAAIIPTRSGDYTFHFFGTVDGQKVDEKFTSSEKTFDSVKEPTAVEFPAKDPSAGDLSTNLDRLNPRVDNAVSLATTDQKTAKSAADKASTARTLGILAIVVAVLLGGSGLLVGLKSRRRA